VQRVVACRTYYLSCLVNHLTAHNCLSTLIAQHRSAVGISTWWAWKPRGINRPRFRGSGAHHGCKAPLVALKAATCHLINNKAATVFDPCDILCLVIHASARLRVWGF